MPIDKGSLIRKERQFAPTKCKKCGINLLQMLLDAQKLEKHSAKKIDDRHAGAIEKGVEKNAKNELPARLGCPGNKKIMVDMVPDQGVGVDEVNGKGTGGGKTDDGLSLRGSNVSFQEGTKCILSLLSGR